MCEASHTCNNIPSTGHIESTEMQKKLFTVIEILEIMTFDRWLLLKEWGKVKSFVLDSLIWYIEEETDPARKLSLHS